MTVDTDQKTPIKSFGLETKVTAASAGILASESGVVADLSPLSAFVSTASVAQEVTIRQVAPLVLILTGASFLVVWLSSLILLWQLGSDNSIDNFCTIGGHHSSLHHSRSPYTRDSPAMDCLSLCFDFRGISSSLRKACWCLWKAIVLYPWLFLDHCYNARCSILFCWDLHVCYEGTTGLGMTSFPKSVIDLYTNCCRALPLPFPQQLESLGIRYHQEESRTIVLRSIPAASPLDRS